MTKTNKTTKKAAGIQTGLQSEVINLLEKKPHTHRQLCDALVLPGESTKPITDTLYRLSSNRIAIKGDDGYIRLISPSQPAQPEVEMPMAEEENDDLPDILPEVQALKDENLALRLKINGLKAELGDALVSANDYASQTETMRQLNQNMDAVFRRLHHTMDEAGAPDGDLEIRVNDLIGQIGLSQPLPAPQPIHGYIVTDLHQIHDTEQEAVDFASAEARPDSTILIAAVVRRGTVPPIAVQWINPEEKEVNHV